MTSSAETADLGRTLQDAISDDSDDAFLNRVSNLLKAGTPLPAAEGFLSLVASPEATVRRRAIFLLSHIGGDAAVEAICGQLADDVEVVRSAAVSSLGRLAAKAAVEPLLALFQSRPDDQALLKAAAEALAKIGDPGALEPLTQASRTVSGFSVRSACMMAVSRLKAANRAQPSS